MVNYKRRSLATALGLVAGACALGGFLAPAGAKSAYADDSGLETEITELVDTEASETNGVNENVGIEPYAASGAVAFEKPLLDDSGLHSGFTLYGKFHAEDKLWPNSDRGHMYFAVIYNEDKRTSPDKYLSIPVTVNAMMTYYWDNGKSCFWNIHLEFNYEYAASSDKQISYEYLANNKYHELGYLYYNSSRGNDEYFYHRYVDVGDYNKDTRGNQWACNRAEIRVHAFQGIRFDYDYTCRTKYEAIQYY